MSITAYTGLPGSGKSYTVVQDVIIPAIKEGRTVYTNIPLNDELFWSELNACPVHFETKEVIDNVDWFLTVFPPGALLVLDECWRLWPSGLKTNNVNASHKEFLAEHRHRVGDDGRSTEVVLVTQDCAQLAAFARQLIEKTYRCKKLDAVGQAKRYRLDIYEGAVAGANPPEDKRLRAIYHEYKPEIYRFYKSHTKSETGEAGDETKIDGRANILKGAKMKSILAGMVLLPILSMVLFYPLYKKYFAKHEEAKPAVSSSQTATAAAQAQRVDGFLHKKSIFISANYSVNGQSIMVFTVHDGDVKTRLQATELLALGYSTERISDCLVVFTGHGETISAMCQDDEYKNPVVSAFTPTMPGASSSM